MTRTITDIYGNAINEEPDDKASERDESKCSSSSLLSFDSVKGKYKLPKKKKKAKAKRKKKREKLKKRVAALEAKHSKHDASLSTLSAECKENREELNALKKTVVKIGRSKLLSDLDTMINAESLSERREAAARIKSSWGDYQ